MVELVRTSHKVFKIKYHFVFCIKYRKDLFLKDKYVDTVKQICENIENRFYIKFETMGFDEDHLHFDRIINNNLFSCENISICEKYNCNRIV